MPWWLLSRPSPDWLAVVGNPAPGLCYVLPVSWCPQNCAPVCSPVSVVWQLYGKRTVVLSVEGPCLCLSFEACYLTTGKSPLLICGPVVSSTDGTNPITKLCCVAMHGVVREPSSLKSKLVSETAQELLQPTWLPRNALCKQKKEACLLLPIPL